MDEKRLRDLLEAVRRGRVGLDEAMSRLGTLPFEDLGFAKVDHHRGVRKGFPEVVFGAGKTPEQVASLAVALLKKSDRLLVTRASEAAFDAVREVAPDATYESVARAIAVDRRARPKKLPGVTVVCAGTADLPVALEACITAEMMDCRVERFFDVGVAGLHRLLEHVAELRRANVVVAVAGMDGVLPSVVGGLVSAPVIAVPTSVGYGASFQGLAALLTMLNSCAPGVGVVNIDNGFGAGYLAARINHAIGRKAPHS
ncbi:MAG: nickel pincer cofactor biosynthesis protein LarB [SAR202 cluster bacterium]|nr:nickel pincer cofactor biosynthesis protein LarB [SAR202 cluster bacterium]